MGGSKPYEGLFKVDKYVGIDIKVSGHNHASSKVDKFYDGKKYLMIMRFLTMFLAQRSLSIIFNLDELLVEIIEYLKRW